MEIYRMPDFFEELKGMETDSMHMHGFYEIIWFQKACGTHYVDFNQYPIEKSGTWSWEGLDFTLFEGAGGHLKGESLLLLEKEKVAFTGDIWCLL